MVRIGVIETHNFEKLAGTIRSIYSLKSNAKQYNRDVSVEFADDIFFSKNCTIPYITDLTRRDLKYLRPNVIIINGVDKTKPIELGRDYSAILVNSDDTDIMKYLNPRIGPVITYGFNSRASVTTSSVREGVINVCVQRTIPSLSGAKIEQQEFKVTMNSRYKDNISHMLAAVTTALIDDKL